MLYLRNNKTIIMYTTKDIEKDEEFQIYLRGKTVTESTLKLYKHRLKEYCNFQKMSLTDLITEAEKEQDEKIKLRYRKVNNRIYNFVYYLENEKELKGGKKGLSSETIRGYIATIKSIYLRAGIVLDRVAMPKMDKDKAFEEIISYDEIKMVVRSATQRERALFLTHMSSGMAAAEVRNLKYSDLLKSVKNYIKTPNYLSVPDLKAKINEIDEPIIPMWRLVRFKTKYPFLTFTSPEAFRETMLYLEERERSRFPVRSEDDFLFVTKTSGSIISKREYSDLFERANDKHHLGREKKNGYRRFQSHYLRRYFSSELMYAGVDHMKRDFMIAHRIDPKEAAYFKMRPDDLLKEYKRVLSRLTFDDVKNITIEDPEVTQMRKELLESQKQNRELAEILQLREKFDKLPKPTKKPAKNI